MPRSRLLYLLALATLAASLLAAAPARAGVTQESTFQDDNLLLYNSQSGVVRTLDILHSLGVDRLRLTIVWRAVAPQADRQTRPSFDATNPAAYPEANWERYDRIIRLARARGMDVNFNMTAPAPSWATGNPSRADIEATYNPSPAHFEDFVRALGRRYSGTYVPGPGRDALPRVDYWSIWNEPNQAGWLTPQWLPRRGGRWHEAAPRIYRALVDAAFVGLAATGHLGDTILVGETAPKGLNVQGVTRSIKPLRFIRAVYCVDRRHRPLRGTVARRLRCPTGGPRRDFVAAHPGLFAATGFAHHPYELTFSPHRKPTDRDFATIANLPKLTRTLGAILATYGHPRPGAYPLYLTEFGYQTFPPDPLGVSLTQQAAYLNESEFIAYANPNVRTLSQFLLEDDRPVPGADRRSIAAWGATFQSGLMRLDGGKKPGFRAYRLPLYLPRPSIRRGQRLRVWGLVRQAENGTGAEVQVQWRRRRSRRGFRAIATVTADPRRGYVDSRVRVPGSGLLRLAWQAPGARKPTYSRTVRVRVR